MIANDTIVELKTLAFLSLLGDEPGSGAAHRLFNGQSVLAGTIERLINATADLTLTVLVWDDQLLAAQQAVAGRATVRTAGPRKPSIMMTMTAAALRWSDGWRGGLNAVTVFDRGFDARSILAAMDEVECNAAMLVDASSALIEPAAIDALVQQLAERPMLDYVFLPGTPGSGAMILRRDALDELHRNQRQPGHLLAYHPDRAVHDPLAKEHAVPVAPRVARSLSRIAIDSGRQVHRLSQLNAANSSTVSIVDQLERAPRLDGMPRDVVLELTPHRASRPIYSALQAGVIQREPLSMDHAKRLFRQLATVDDVRLTLAGVGDPILHAEFVGVVRAAREAGIKAIHVETDLMTAPPAVLDVLASGAIDVVSIHLPAVHRDTYAAIMGVDRIQDVLENLKQLVTRRSRNGSGLPIIVPTFTKCERNMGEMESWYDQWIRALGTAVILAPSDFGGAIPYTGVSDMLPPNRGQCRRLQSRMTILSDGRVASCEEDVQGNQSVGQLDQSSVEGAWSMGLDAIRHGGSNLSLCKSCRMWDRP